MPVDSVPVASARKWSPGQTRPLWWRWINRGALATIDQGLVSGSNFILTVMLARWLTVADYGGYGLVLSVFYLITAVHQALLLEPMSILGASRYGDCRREYMTVLLRLNSVFSAVAALLLAALALFARLIHAPGSLPSALAALALSFPATLFFWLVRGGCYLELTPGPSALASLGYSVLLLGGVYALKLFGWISAASVLLLAGAAGGIGAMIVLFRFRLASNPENPAPPLREIWHEHWRYGRWALASTAVMWTPENICYAFAGMSLGIAQGGVLRAMNNLIVPALQLVGSSSRLIYPWLSGKTARQGNTRTRADVAKIGIVFTAVGLLYASILLLFHKQVLHLLYGNRFGEAADLIGWVGLVTISYLVLYAPMIGLRVIQSPFLVFVGYCGAAVVAVTAGYPLTLKYGLRGTIANLFIANLAGAVLGAWLFHKRTRREGNSQASS
jgi:O-antigen/teichoic acid export membrane protein